MNLSSCAPPLNHFSMSQRKSSHQVTSVSRSLWIKRLRTCFRRLLRMYICLSLSLSLSLSLYILMYMRVAGFWASEMACCAGIW